MNGQLLEEINTTMFTSSKQGKELVTELTRKSGFSSENIISRLAISRSLQEDIDFKHEYASDPRGKQIRGKTLLGKKETALVLLAMLIISSGENLENEDIKQKIRLHWERGLRLLNQDSKDKEMKTLFLEYAKEAALNSDLVQTGLGSPQAKLKESFVGQQVLKNELLSKQEEIIEDQDSFAEVLSLISGTGTGKTHIINEFGNALGLEVIILEKHDFKNATTLLSNIKSKLQQKGVLFEEDLRAFTIPNVILSIENMNTFTDKETGLVKQLKPMKTSTLLSGGTKLNFQNGILFISSTEAVNWAQMYYFEPYSRSEITQIIRRNVQGGTEEVRKFIALSGRLNPKLSIEKMEEAIAYAKNLETPKPLSEAVIFELMDDVWETNKVGLSKADIDLLKQIENGALPSVLLEDEADMNFFIGQRFLTVQSGNIEVAYERIKRILEAEKLKDSDGDN